MRTAMAAALVFAVACSAGTYAYLDSHSAVQGPSKIAPEVLGAAEGRTARDRLPALTR